VPAGSEEARELCEAGKQYLASVSMILRECPGSAQIPAASFVQGLTLSLWCFCKTADVSLKKSAVNFFWKMSQSPLMSMPEVSAFYGDFVVPEIIRSIVSSHLKVTDHPVQVFITEVAKLLIGLSSFIPAFDGYIGRILSQLVPPESAGAVSQFAQCITRKDKVGVCNGLAFFSNL